MSEMSKPIDPRCRTLRYTRMWVFLLSILILAVMARVAHLQANAAHRSDVQIVDITGVGALFARRGAILDRDGRVLSATHVGY